MRVAGTVRLEDVLAYEYSTAFRVYLSEKGHQKHTPKVFSNILPLESVLVIFLGGFCVFGFFFFGFRHKF